MGERIDETPVYRIVFTGGPCGGKSTALSAVTDRLEGLGLQVYRVPETATLLLGGGVSVRDTTPDHLLGIQAQMLRVIMSLEDAFYAVAKAAGRPAVLLCDRDTMDVSAYLSPEAWTAVLNEHDWTVVGLRDRRYEAVIHLVTAADGAEACYTTENNAVRTETPVQARMPPRLLPDATPVRPISSAWPATGSSMNDSRSSLGSSSRRMPIMTAFSRSMRYSE